MAKNTAPKMEAKKRVCSWCDWSTKEWLMAAVSEGALYLLIWYGLWMLEVSVINQWLGALVSLVLLNVSLLTCPVIRKHFLSK